MVYDTPVAALLYRSHSSASQTLFLGIERVLKQALVDKSCAVSYAALVSAYSLFSTSKEVSSPSPATQYHALGLLYLVRAHDRMAVLKMIQSLARSIRSLFACCMLVKFTARMIAEEGPTAYVFTL